MGDRRFHHRKLSAVYMEEKVGDMERGGKRSKEEVEKGGRKREEEKEREEV